MNNIFVRNIARTLASSVLLGGILFAQGTPQNTTDSATSDDIVYEPGTKGITPPRATYQPTPEYTDNARKKKLNGIVIVSLVVTPDGATRDVKILKGLDPGLDKNAVATVGMWRFDPATKDGKPVAVRVAVEVLFHLY